MSSVVHVGIPISLLMMSCTDLFQVLQRLHNRGRRASIAVVIYDKYPETGEINGATYFARVHSIRDEILPADRILVNDCDGKVDTECRTFAFTWAFGVSVSTVKFNKMFDDGKP